MTSQQIIPIEQVLEILCKFDFDHRTLLQQKDLFTFNVDQHEFRLESNAASPLTQKHDWGWWIYLQENKVAYFDAHEDLHEKTYVEDLMYHLKIKFDPQKQKKLLEYQAAFTSLASAIYPNMNFCDFCLFPHAIGFISRDKHEWIDCDRSMREELRIVQNILKTTAQIIPKTTDQNGGFITKKMRLTIQSIKSAHEKIFMEDHATTLLPKTHAWIQQRFT